jgi:8-oxo-dGTP pyrophosphatase MutT (NUDIX family)
MAHEVQRDGRVHGVVFGCRRAGDGRYLMVRRSRHVEILPGKVCFPGGGVCVGESQEAACAREAREELGVAIRPIRAVWRHEFADRPLTLFGWSAALAEGPIRPDPLEVAEVLWLTRDEALAHPDGLPTNRSFIDALEASPAPPEVAGESRE